MPWTEVSEMDLKAEFVSQARQPKSNISKLCRQFNISRKTGYQLLARAKAGASSDNLKARSRRPNYSPNKTAPCVEKLILFTRDNHPHWGGDKIRAYLLREGHTDMPSSKTVNRILKRHGRICAEESLKHKKFIRFEHEHPNDLWQMDFKGDFKTRAQRCYPLTLLDDHSRYSLAIVSCSNQRHHTVKQALSDIFRSYGLPKRMTMDNGNPWGCSAQQLHTRLTVWLIRLGIVVSHSRPYHPQTQGKLERFHRTMKTELLSMYSFDDLLHAQQGFDWWRHRYNEHRPHAAIKNQVPAQRYSISHNPFVETLPPIEYDKHAMVRKVNSDGIISYQNKRYRIGEAFAGRHIALEETQEDNMMHVRFCHQIVYKIDLNNVAA